MRATGAISAVCIVGFCGLMTGEYPSSAANTPRSQQRSAQRASPLTAAEVFQRYSDAVALVEAFDEPADKIPSRFGSGVLLEQSSLLITNAHVIGDARRVRTRTGKNIAGNDDIKLLYIDTASDVAVLSLQQRTVGLTDLHFAGLPKVGTKVFAIGNPAGFERTISEGIVSGLRRFADLGTLIQHTAPISGMSH